VLLGGELLLAQGDFSNALQLFENILDEKHCPPAKRATAYRMRGDALAYQGRYKEAAEGYSQVLETTQSVLAGDHSAPPQGSVGNTISKLLASTPVKARSKELRTLLADAQTALERLARCQMLLQEVIGDLEGDLLTAHDIAVSTPAGMLRGAVLLTTLAFTLYPDAQILEGVARRALGEFSTLQEQAQASVQESSQDVAALLNLAWSLYGQAACFEVIGRRRMEAAAADAAGLRALIGSPAMDCLQTIFEVLETMPVEDRNSIIDLLNLAFKSTEPAGQSDRAGLAADRLVGFLLGDMASQPTGFFELVARGAPVAPAKGSAEEASVEKLVIAYAGPSGLDANQIRTLRGLVKGCLEAAIAPGKPGLISELLQTAKAQVLSNYLWQKSMEVFGKLERISKRSGAENYYGMACVAAFKRDAKNAVHWLRDASRRAGEDSFLYRNRAALDVYFDTIRADARFRSFLAWEGPPGSFPDEMLFAEAVDTGAIESTA
jgi:tetratricopeptide (TPR) repeat protein